MSSKPPKDSDADVDEMETDELDLTCNSKETTGPSCEGPMQMVERTDDTNEESLLGSPMECSDDDDLETSSDVILFSDKEDESEEGNGKKKYWFLLSWYLFISPALFISSYILYFSVSGVCFRLHVPVIVFR